jgi:hypothetical protein
LEGGGLMPRLRDRRWRYEPTVEATLDLMIGPTDAPGELTVGQLEVAWEVERDRITDGYNGPPGTRPWAFWVFDLGEEPPRPDDDDQGGSFALEAVRLAELGELTDDELAALREQANEAKLRIGTGSERISGGWRKYGISMDQQDVDLWEAVCAAQGASE